MNDKIAKRLIFLRKEKKYSQEEVAEVLGVSRQAVSKWERGECSPDTDNLIRLAKLYHLSLDEVLLGSNTNEKEENKTETVFRDVRNDDEREEENKEKSFYQSSKWRKMEKEMDDKVKNSKVPYPLLVTILYLILGFGWKLWHPGWVIFLTIPLHGLKKGNASWRVYLASPVMVTIIYILLGHYFNLWHPSWLLFLCVPIFQRYANGNIG